jgi:hypothetical protein
VKRYREWDSFPGFGIDEIAARDFGKALVELNLPPLRFSNIGKPSIFLSSMRPTLFAGLLDAEPISGGPQTYEDVGGQLDWNFTAAFRLPMVLSFGDAVGLTRDQHPHNELMLSLKIM